MAAYQRKTADERKEALARQVAQMVTQGAELKARAISRRCSCMDAASIISCILR